MSSTTIYDANYSILTREQFETDFPNAQTPEGRSDDNVRALVFHDDDEVLIAAFWGAGNDLATFTADLAKYAASSANPGPVQAKVGRNVTVVE